MKNFRFLLALAAVLFVASTHAQIVVKAGNDGKVYEPQPLGLGVTTATSVNGLTITSSTGTLTIANSGGLVTSGAYVGTFTFTGTTGVTFPQAD